MNREESSENDIVLSDLARAGDMNAFKKLFDRYYIRLRVVATKILGSEEDAADVCQEAFLKAYKNLDSFKGESSFYTWIYRIMYNLSIDLTRKASRRYEHATDSEVLNQVNSLSALNSDNINGSIRSPEEETYRGEISRAISKALNELSPSHRAILMLREHDGMSYDEISETLECSIGTVMSRLHHARKRIVDILNKALNENTYSSKVGAK